MNITEKIDKLITEFSVFEDWTDKYSYLIEKGKTCPMIADVDKNDKFLIKGCQSRVWIKPEFKDSKLFFYADSDAVITKGIVAIVLYVFSGESPQTIIDTPTDFIDKIGLKEHLSPARSNGLIAMIKQIKLYAIALNLKGSSKE